MRPAHRPLVSPVVRAAVRRHLLASVAVASLFALSACGGGGGGGTGTDNGTGTGNGGTGTTWNMSGAFSGLYTNGVITPIEMTGTASDGTAYRLSFQLQPSGTQETFEGQPRNTAIATQVLTRVSDGVTAGFQSKQFFQLSPRYYAWGEQTLARPSSFTGPTYFVNDPTNASFSALPSNGAAGSSGSFYAQSQYADATKSAVVGSVVVKWAVEAGPAAGTAYLCFRESAAASGGACYLFDGNGALVGMRMPFPVLVGSKVEYVTFSKTP